MTIRDVAASALLDLMVATLEAVLKGPEDIMAKLEEAQARFARIMLKIDQLVAAQGEDQVAAFLTQIEEKLDSKLGSSAPTPGNP